VEIAQENFPAAPTDEQVKQNLIAALIAAGAIHDPTTDVKLLKRAITFYDEAVQLDPQNVEALNWRGYLNACLGKKEQSRSDFAQAFQIEPENTEALRRSGWACIISNEQSAALEKWAALDQIIKRSGKDPSANALIALAAESWLRGAREEAIARYNRAATLEATLKDPHFLQEWDLPPRMKQLIEAIFRAGMLSSPH
jgi:tetratricopeptide (TPR) repeat protein